MKNFKRSNQLFSLCGLNCALCRMKIDGYCPGCGGGDGNQGCSIAGCSVNHNNYEYCFECSEYPCDKYNNIAEYDSFITHRNPLIDMKRAMIIGIENYNNELKEKSDILKFLLSNYNDGRKKAFFCLSINLLSLEDIHIVLEQIKTQISGEKTLKEKSLIAVKCFEDMAQKREIKLKLNKKR